VRLEAMIEPGKGMPTGGDRAQMRGWRLKGKR